MMWDLLERLHRTLMLFNTTGETKEMQDLMDRVTAALVYADAYQLRKGTSPAPPPPPGTEQGPVRDTVPVVAPPLNPVTVMMQHAHQQLANAMNQASATMVGVVAARNQIMAQRDQLRTQLHQGVVPDASDPGISQ